MPSLRRSASISSVARSSPYPTSSASFAAGVRVAGHGPRRRFTASETSNRRVLAEIEWWKVCPNPGELPDGTDDQAQGQDDHGGLSLISVQDGAERPSTPEGSPRTSIFAPPEYFALSIAPITPPRRSGHSLESSWSSLESSPEDATDNPIDIARLGAHELSTVPDARADSDSEPVTPSLNELPNLRKGRTVSRPTRSYSLTDIMSLNTSRSYADFSLSPLSPAQANGLSN